MPPARAASAASAAAGPGALASEEGLPASGRPWPPGASSSLGRAALCGLAERSLCSPRRCFFWPPAESSFGFLTSCSLLISQDGSGLIWWEGSEGGAGCDGENGERTSSRQTPTSGRPGEAAAGQLQELGSSAGQEAQALGTAPRRLSTLPRPPYVRDKSLERPKPPPPPPSLPRGQPAAPAGCVFAALTTPAPPLIDRSRK